MSRVSVKLSQIARKKPAFQFELNNGVHFRKGSPEPEWPNDGRIRLYSMRFSLCSSRVHLVLNAKNIPYNVAYCELVSKPEWLLTKTPANKVPAIELPNGQVLAESLVIADYLDEVYPETPLHSKDPLQKAQDKFMIAKFAGFSRSLMAISYGFSRNREEDMAKINQLFRDFELDLAKRGTLFFYGSRVGMLDLMIWPWVYMFINTRVPGFNLETFPSLERWICGMLEQEAVQGHFIRPEEAETFVIGDAKGQAPYNLLATRASL